ncbi:hypothetical protein K470DRAFT_250696 [Piedraia hortae CBS 480.64]|uniref:protein disulfide-isomerase n=1 Tax=Piedraia hortae CBS 480.64 TaxID=1314780 RepID=A0A6A7BW53_9PEZI|nr:hypothetical protein K470DRAFT_250696 [Piedraia hortae CBS 480.64]
MTPLTTLLLSLLSLLSLPPSTLALYPSNSPILQITPPTLPLLVSSNRTTLLEFYAPWCIHCRNLAPTLLTSAKHLSGLVNVAAINCDSETNKALCAEYNIRGFPTLKLIKPREGKRPQIGEYTGPRTVKGIVDSMVENIPDYVRSWEEGGAGTRAVVFSKKKGAMTKALAVDFKGKIEVMRVKEGDKKVVEEFGVETWPALVVVKGQERIWFEGEMDLPSMRDFLAGFERPNEDVFIGERVKQKSGKGGKKTEKSAGKKSDKRPTEKKPTEPAKQPPKDHPPSESEIDPIPSLQETLTLQQSCLNTARGLCILALLPTTPDLETITAIASLSTLAQRPYSPKIYQIPESNPQSGILRKKLELGEGRVVILATNGKRGWASVYPGETKMEGLKGWVEDLRLGEVVKRPLPGGMVVDEKMVPKQNVKPNYSKMGKGESEIDDSGMDRDRDRDRDSEMEKMRESIKGQLPEGVEFELEEIGEGEYERLAGGNGHDEL